MAALTLSGALAGLILLVLVQAVTVALSRSLRTYSRSRLEVVCAARQHRDLVRTIEIEEEASERAADAVSVVAEVFGAAWLTILLPIHSASVAVGVAGLAVILLHFLASLGGRVWAETFLVHAWPVARPLRIFAWPFTTLARGSEMLVNNLLGVDEGSPRPASVEVEILPDGDHPEKLESDVPISTRSLLEHVVVLTQLDASEVMTPRSGMTVLPATVTAHQAAEKFCETGYSRIPVFGENRDDIVGVLYAKDLFPLMVDAMTTASTIQPRKLVRPAYFVPESKNAHDLLNELRVGRSQLAIVLDEYGGVAGLVTLEDLFEQLVGPIDDEHDVPSRDERIKPLSETRYEVDATMALGLLNHRLRLQLPTDGKYQTLGGYAFNELGRLPAPGEMFVAHGVRFTILEVVERSIRRVLMEVR